MRTRSPIFIPPLIITSQKPPVFGPNPREHKMVDGEIAPTGWCSLWVKKPA